MLLSSASPVTADPSTLNFSRFQLELLISRVDDIAKSDDSAGPPAVLPDNVCYRMLVRDISTFMVQLTPQLFVDANTSPRVSRVIGFVGDQVELRYIGTINQMIATELAEVVQRFGADTGDAFDQSIESILIWMLERFGQEAE
ncbi:hypothetical protein K227x_62360 [Rubripirellula lacrimiformis]|uniref:Uncharacterized protein n=1 Tax=Rubripirellula lacrimiformis TaxID=1930273 RepID=A0A517NKY9_9BACT|nr:hypothetical protein [Rubripirellula lacrimiformis]QDT07808.1 hypothetical protein K227x_62360 [Rubripirellula lacrimiformis]